MMKFMLILISKNNSKYYVSIKHQNVNTTKDMILKNCILDGELFSPYLYLYKNSNSNDK